MINLPSAAVEAPKKGNAPGKVKRVKSSMGDNRRDQVAHRRKNHREYQTGKHGKDHSTGTIRPMDPAKINVDTMIAFAGDMPRNSSRLIR